MREPLDREAFHEALLAPGSPWTGVDVHPSLGSTNAEAARVGRLWHVVATDHQQAGRGRLGRGWQTPAMTSLTMSALVPVPASGVGWVPLLAGLAVLRGIGDAAGVATELKWPNDVLVPGTEGGKVCGVLCELHPAGVVVGIGINVDQSREELPVEEATSLRLAGAVAVDRVALAAAVLGHLARLHDALAGAATGLGAARAAYREACGTIGQEVDLHLAEGVRRACAVGVDDEGRLVVRDRATEYAVAAGDVVHVRRAAGQEVQR